LTVIFVSLSDSDGSELTQLYTLITSLAAAEVYAVLGLLDVSRVLVAGDIYKHLLVKMCVSYQII